MTKKILITGKNSYVGMQLAEWLNKEPEKYEVVKESVRDDKWKTIDFSKFDVVVHVAGIAHMKETKKNQELYFKVNRDLAFGIAKKAKLEGVKQFVFLSTMSVYGISNGLIKRDTSLNPKSVYGKSKKEAEDSLQSLVDDSFILSILRPPMIYGNGCKGNYPRLASLALKTPLFLNIENERSMLYIDHLSEFIKQLIDNQQDGVFFPQNENYVNTSEMIKLVADFHGKQLKMTKIFNPIIRLLNVGIVNKVFGTLVYDLEISEISKNYRICDFKESIKRTELRD